MHRDHAQHRGQYVHFLIFFKLVRHSYGFWFVIFNCGVFFQGGPGTLYILLLLSFCFMQLLFVGVGEYVRNNWHLAANFGTNLRVVFLGGVGPLFFHLGRCEVVFENYFRVLLSAASSYIGDTAHTEINTAEISRGDVRTGCLFLLVSLWCSWLLVSLTCIFHFMGSAFRVADGIL